MQALRSLTFNEKFAVGLLVLFGPAYLIAAASFGPNSVRTGEEFGALILWLICWAVVAFIAFCAAFATIFFKPDIHSSRLRMHAGRFLPLSAMIVATFLSSVAMNGISSRQMRAFAVENGNALAGKAPRAVVYREGIPDGGVAIVRSPGRNPEYFTQAEMLALTGERIKNCKRLSEVDWSCHFD